tara:strand:+ start:121 stop:321 length:201 start_codon:yes stop_codon:yes gene_type:complete
MKEPSSYAALGGGVVGIGVLISQPVVIIIGIVGGAAGFLLKEKALSSYVTVDWASRICVSSVYRDS